VPEFSVPALEQVDHQFRISAGVVQRDGKQKRSRAAQPNFPLVDPVRVLNPFAQTGGNLAPLHVAKRLGSMPLGKLIDQAKCKLFVSNRRHDGTPRLSVDSLGQIDNSPGDVLLGPGILERSEQMNPRGTQAQRKQGQRITKARKNENTKKKNTERAETADQSWPLIGTAVSCFRSFVLS
jgi:hypothetical protein